MDKEKKNKVKGLFGTLLFHALLLFLLSLPFMSLTYQDPPTKKVGGSVGIAGITINVSSKPNTSTSSEKAAKEANNDKDIITSKKEKIKVADNKNKTDKTIPSKEDKPNDDTPTVVKLTEEEAKFDQDRDGVLSEKERKIYEKIRRIENLIKGVTVTPEGRNDEADLGDLGNGENEDEYQLGNNRNPTFLPKPIYDSEAEGKVVVHIIVDTLGNVFFANPGEKGSTTLNEQLLDRAKEAALKTKYPPKEDVPNQHGKLIYTFQKN